MTCTVLKRISKYYLPEHTPATEIVDFVGEFLQDEFVGEKEIIGEHFFF
jgi:hypothetical protein